MNRRLCLASLLATVLLGCQADKDAPSTTPSTVDTSPSTDGRTDDTAGSTGDTQGRQTTVTAETATTTTATTGDTGGVATGDTGATGATADTGTRTDTATDPGTLRIATWNVANLDEEGEGDNPRTADDLALLASYVERLDADVVALQEVRGVTGTQTIFPDSEWHAECEDRNSAQNVCVLLREGSGWTMTRNADVTELNASDPNLREGLDLTLSRPGHEELRILAVHLKFGCLFGETNGDCSVLFDQFDVVEEWMDARTTAGEAHLVLGDFNRFLTAGDTAWDDLDDGAPAGTDLTRSIPQGTPTPCWSDVFSEFVDHIVLDATSAGWMTASDQLVYDETGFYKYYQQLSDHCPLWADLQVPAAP